MGFDKLSNQVIGCALEVHRTLGPGLLESSYEQCLAYELSQAGIPFCVQRPVPLKYKEIRLDCGYRTDLFIDDKLIVELKSVDNIRNSQSTATYIHETFRGKNRTVDQL